MASLRTQSVNKLPESPRQGMIMKWGDKLGD